MLNQINIRDYAIVDELDLELQNGMTVVSGETGAGKSIMLDALGLTLGDRADSGAVRNGAERAEITASFDVSNIPEAQAWLHQQELDQDGECILRRVITREGRSRCYINNRPSPIGAVRELSEHLIDIHGQHEHQRLLKKEHHRLLLDQYAGAGIQAGKTQRTFNEWRKLDKTLRQLTEASDEQAARIQLLSYQIEELDQISPTEGELQDLEQEQKQLANASEILHSGHQLMALTTEGEGDNCLALLNQCLQLLGNMSDQQGVTQVSEMLNSAHIQIEEAGSELRHYLDGVELNPERQMEVEERLSTLYDVARKHKVQPEALPRLHQELAEELHDLQNSDEALEQLQHDVEQKRDQFREEAKKLSAMRAKAARKLSKAVDEQLHNLGMLAANFTVQLTPYETDQLNATGLEEVEFLISTNKGQQARPLAKIASGGELSRISLAIQVITAQTSSTPTLIFDEVDVGIGGAVAEVVGRLMRQLGERTQVLCVTHQPQVASQGHQHLFVSKKARKQQTFTRINRLRTDERVQEVARMLGGIEITERSIEHAREMLNGAITH
ncbi:DNA repair protein RecN [Pontibacterium granulatum]|uniref:DNA repair protein RecN n=1 Tax=Pontibacterium granulatum TaxID=2036029 RepID=UPI00249AE308|nr:DNA repair protein RecN [Pontibacterium granulatum]MDI3323087.1 DNA repair protein RecN [Pontibacterium granulatum]